ncbi:hypothetical protein CRYUN_Cryun35bG0093400 [Craigia yunnanensis]
MVFKYEGNSLFHVLIFYRSASEIDYPYSSTKDDDDTSIEFCDEILANRKSEEKSHLPCFTLWKKIGTDSPNQT